MKKTPICLCVSLLATLVCGAAFAEATVSDVAKLAVVSGRFFIGYENGQLSGNKPEFSISRAYIDLKREISNDLSLRLTTDVERSLTAEGDARYELFLKFAYFDLKNLGIPVIGLDTIRLGQSGTAWISMMDNYWNYRYVQKTITDYFGTYSSADLGVAALGSINFGIPGLTKLDYHGTIMNGGGFKNAEANYQKDFSLLFKTDPVSWGEKDKITAAVNYYVKDLGGIVSPITVINAMLAVQFTSPVKGLVFAEYAAPADKTGFSVGGQFEVFSGANIFARLDSYDPDANAGGDEKNLDIIGLEYLLSDSARVAIDHQNELASGIDVVKKASLHFDIKW